MSSDRLSQRILEIYVARNALINERWDREKVKRVLRKRAREWEWKAETRRLYKGRMPKEIVVNFYERKARKRGMKGNRCDCERLRIQETHK